MAFESPSNLTASETAQIKFQAEFGDLGKTIQANPAPKSNLYLASLTNKPKPIKNKAKMRDVFPGIDNTAQGGCTALVNRELNPTKEEDKPWFDAAWYIGDQIENKLGGTKIFSVFDEIPDNLKNSAKIQTFIKQQVAKNKEKIASLNIPEKAIVTLYYPNSHYQEEAYKNGKDKNPPVVSTHAGVIKNGKLTHNVKNKAGDGIIYVEDIKDFYAQSTNVHHCLITGVYDAKRDPNKYKALSGQTVYKYFAQHGKNHGYKNFNDYESDFKKLNKTTALKAGDYYTLPQAKNFAPTLVPVNTTLSNNTSQQITLGPKKLVWNVFESYKAQKGTLSWLQYQKVFRDMNNDCDPEKVTSGDTYNFPIPDHENQQEAKEKNHSNIELFSSTPFDYRDEKYQLRFKNVPQEIEHVLVVGKKGTKYESSAVRLKRARKMDGTLTDTFYRKTEVTFLRDKSDKYLWMPEEATVEFEASKGKKQYEKEFSINNQPDPSERPINAWDEVEYSGNSSNNRLSVEVSSVDQKKSLQSVMAVSGDTGSRFFKKYGEGMTYGQYRDWFKANNGGAWEKISLKKYNVQPLKTGAEEEKQPSSNIDSISTYKIDKLSSGESLWKYFVSQGRSLSGLNWTAYLAQFKSLNREIDPNKLNTNDRYKFPTKG